MDKKSEKFWRAQLEGLRGPLPEVGDEPPIEESATAAIEKADFKETNGIDPAAIGNLSKLTMDVYFFMNTEDNRYFMMQAQSMMDYGEKTLKESLDIVARKRKRK